jgi:hypothetical protein
LFSSSFSGSPDNQSINDGRIDKPSSLVWILLVFADLDSFTAAFKGLDWILLFQLLSFIGLDLVFGLSDLDASAFRGIGLV